MIGLKRGTVILAKHSPQWKKIFEKEAKKLREIFGEDALEVHHVGSTAIPGIQAKPIIDIAIVVPGLAKANSYEKKLKAIGYNIKKDDLRKRERLFFTKGSEENRTHYLHICEIGSNYIEEMILFRDYLCAHKKFAQEYTALKEQLARKYQNERKTYTEKKREMVVEIVKRARGSFASLKKT